MSLFPYFYKASSIIGVSTPDGADHGYMIIVGLDPMAGRKRRYSVLLINCQTGTTTCHGRELPIKHAKEIQNDLVLAVYAIRNNTKYMTAYKIKGWGKLERIV